MTPPQQAAPRKPWAKPTVRVIGETMDDVLSGANREMYELGVYYPAS